MDPLDQAVIMLAQLLYGEDEDEIATYWRELLATYSLVICRVIYKRAFKRMQEEYA